MQCMLVATCTHCFAQEQEEADLNAKIMQQWCKTYAEIMQNICNLQKIKARIIQNIMQHICRNSANNMQRFSTHMQQLCNTYVKHMQTLCIHYAKNMHTLCINYEKTQAPYVKHVQKFENAQTTSKIRVFFYGEILIAQDIYFSHNRLDEPDAKNK